MKWGEDLYGGIQWFITDHYKDCWCLEHCLEKLGIPPSDVIKRHNLPELSKRLFSEYRARDVALSYCRKNTSLLWDQEDVQVMIDNFEKSVIRIFTGEIS